MEDENNSDVDNYNYTDGVQDIGDKDDKTFIAELRVDNHAVPVDKLKVLTGMQHVQVSSMYDW